MGSPGCPGGEARLLRGVFRVSLFSLPLMAAPILIFHQIALQLSLQGQWRELSNSSRPEAGSESHVSDVFISAGAGETSTSWGCNDPSPMALSCP